MVHVMLPLKPLVVPTLGGGCLSFGTHSGLICKQVRVDSRTARTKIPCFLSYSNWDFGIGFQVVYLVFALLIVIERSWFSLFSSEVITKPGY